MRYIVGYQGCGNTMLCTAVAAAYGAQIEKWADISEAIGDQNSLDYPVGWRRTHAICTEKPGDWEGGLCIVRHPFDACLAGFRYVRRVDMGLGEPDLDDPDIKFQLNAWIDLFVEHGGALAFNTMNGGGMEQVIGSWMEIGAGPVKYEHMRTAPRATLMSALYRCNGGHLIPRSDADRAAQAIEPKSMGALEGSNDFVGPCEIGRWQRYFSAEQAARGRETFSWMMERFSYV